MDLLKKLHKLACSLPQNVPEAIEKDYGIASAFQEFINKETNPDEAWEIADGALNIICGADVDPKVIASGIRRGPKGLTRLVEWIQNGVDDFGLEPGMLEGKLQRLCEAVLKL